MPRSVAIAREGVEATAPPGMPSSDGSIEDASRNEGNGEKGMVCKGRLMEAKFVATP